MRVDLPVQPAHAPHGGSIYTLEDLSLTLTPKPDGLSYARTGLAKPKLLGMAPGARPTFLLQLFEGETVALFATPIHVSPHGTRRLWIGWPLDVVVLAGDPEERVDLLQPGRRRTLFGPVNLGRVLPAVDAVVLDGPASATLLGRPFAALAIHVESRVDQPLTLTRVPVEGKLLALSKRDGSLAAGEVGVVLLTPTRAEAITKPMKPPPGFGSIQASAGTRAPTPPPGAPLQWLLEANRRPTEYAP